MRNRRVGSPSVVAVALTLLVGHGAVAGAQGLGVYDPAPAWPLCGRITENPPPGWVEADGCPAERFGDPAFHDGPISSTFGPRQLPSDDFRYDFHRGIDIATPIGTPLFAFADGEVQIAGVDPGYTDPVISIRHLRPGFNGCIAGGGCYTSLYLHVSGWVVGPGDPVVKGQLIGYSGASSESDFAHVHFEIRDAPPQDPYSAWQRDCVHPLGALPYPDGGASNIELSLDDVDLSDPMTPKITARVVIPMTVELDLEGLEAEVYERSAGGVLTPIPQPGDVRVGNTIEGDGYAVDPPWYSMNTWCRHWSYKDSGAIPWSSFLSGGSYESPYESSLPLSYDPNVHLDHADPGDFQVGLFNGMSFAPIHYNAQSEAYQVTYRFLALGGAGDAASLCLRVRAKDARGNATDWVSYNCPVTSCPAAPRGDCRGSDRASLMMRANGEAADRLKWALRGGPATVAGDFLAPGLASTTTYSLCVWDDSGAPGPVFGVDVAGSASCAGGPCWKPLGSAGFKFRDKSATPDGVTAVRLKSGAQGKTRLRIVGRGGKLPALALPLSLPATAQLIVDDGLTSSCWQSAFSAGTNDGTRVKLRMP